MMENNLYFSSFYWTTGETSILFTSLFVLENVFYHKYCCFMLHGRSPEVVIAIPSLNVLNVLLIQIKMAFHHFHLLLSRVPETS